MLTFALPVFVSVTVCVALLLPTVTFPKLKDVGLAESVRIGATPVPLIGTHSTERTSARKSNDCDARQFPPAEQRRPELKLRRASQVTKMRAPDSTSHAERRL